jgi:hypothetical protein
MPDSYVIEHTEYRPPIWGIPQTDRAESIGYAPLGRTFYVHGTLGVDINDSEGLVKDFPLRTITNAISRCTAGANDIIEVLYYPSAGATGEVWPIIIDVEGVKLIGGTGEIFSDTTRLIRPPVASGAACPCIGVNANNVEIAGFWLECQAGSTASCIQVPGPGATAATYRTIIHHCVFGVQNPAAYGVGNLNAPNLDAVNLDIHDCLFENQISVSAIFIGWNATRGQFHDNIFRKSGNPAISLAVSAATVWGIYNNVFSVVDAGAGEAITCAAGPADCLFFGNLALNSKVAFANIPWTEAGTGHWGNNMSNVLLVNPA